MLELSYSQDGGAYLDGGPGGTALGKIGEYRVRARHRRLGSGRDRRFRVRFSDPCKLTILGAFVDYEGTAA